MTEDRIPTLDTYREISIHDRQSSERVDLVKRELDHVMAVDRLSELFDYCGDVTKSPEARMLAGAKARAVWERAADERRNRPDIDLAVVQARVAALDSARCRSRHWYCSIFDVWPPGGPGAVARDEPLPR